MQHNALLPTALHNGAAKAARNKMRCKALESSLLFHSPLCSTPCCVPARLNNRSTEYNYQMTSHVGSDSGNFGLGSSKDKHENRARVPAVVRWGDKKKTGDVTKSTKVGKT
jgi:hypothetical protein